jgi:hypothetical protein
LQGRLKKSTRVQRAVTRHPSPVTRHPSPVTRHPSPGSRKPKGRNHRKQAARQLGHEHRKVSKQRATTRHPVTPRLAKTTAVLVSDDLNLAGMVIWRAW